MKTEEFKTELRRLVEKDMNSIKRIYVEYFPKIYGMSLAMTKDKQVAYDLSMEVILKLINYKGDIDQIKNPIGLLVTMTKNTVKDYWRELKFSAGNKLLEEIANFSEQDNFWLSDILKNLERQERQLFMDHVIWGKSLGVIAKELDVSVITVKRRYKKIKNKIKEYYNQE